MTFHEATTGYRQIPTNSLGGAGLVRTADDYVRMPSTPYHAVTPGSTTTLCGLVDVVDLGKEWQSSIGGYRDWCEQCRTAAAEPTDT